MGLIILRHGKNRNHGDGAVLALLTSGSLIQGSQVSVHISRITAAARNFLTGCGNLTQRVCVVGNISQDNQYVHVLFKCQVLCCCQSHTRSCDTLYGRVVSQVDEHNASVDSACLAEALHEEVCLLKGNTHGCKHNGEGLVGAAHLCLTRNLGSQVGVRKTGCRENRQLLAADQGVQTIYGGNASLDKLLRIASGCRVHRQAVDIHTLLRQDVGTAVNGLAHAVKHTAEHILRHA